jgi:hypothetical protein
MWCADDEQEANQQDASPVSEESCGGRGKEINEAAKRVWFVLACQTGQVWCEPSESRMQVRSGAHGPRWSADCVGGTGRKTETSLSLSIEKR